MKMVAVCLQKKVLLSVSDAECQVAKKVISENLTVETIPLLQIVPVLNGDDPFEASHDLGLTSILYIYPSVPRGRGTHSIIYRTVRRMWHRNYNSRMSQNLPPLQVKGEATPQHASYTSFTLFNTFTTPHSIFSTRQNLCTKGLHLLPVLTIHFSSRVTTTTTGTLHRFSIDYDDTLDMGYVSFFDLTRFFT